MRANFTKSNVVGAVTRDGSKGEEDGMFRCISLHRRWTVLRETRTFEYLINFQLSAGGSHKFRHARGSLKSWERSRFKREIKKRWLGRGESWPGVRLLKRSTGRARKKYSNLFFAMILKFIAIKMNDDNFGKDVIRISARMINEFKCKGINLNFYTKFRWLDSQDSILASFEVSIRSSGSYFKLLYIQLRWFN